MIDLSTDFGQRAAQHLRDDHVVWLTTVTPGGQPVPSPVWFWWDGGETVRMYSMPDTTRVRNLEANQKVALNFRGTETGGDIVVFNGRATVLGDSEPPHEHTAYIEKYASGLQGLDMTPEQFAARYSTAIDIVLTKVRGF